jgi:hypothetical protein
LNLGDLATVTQGDVRELPVNLARLLQPGEAIVSATARMAVWPYSPVNDANAANLVLGLPQIADAVVSVQVGGYGASGFQAGAVYSLWIIVVTSFGEMIEAHGQITCGAEIPPVQTSGPAEAFAPTNLTFDLSTFGDSLI